MNITTGRQDMERSGISNHPDRGKTSFAVRFAGMMAGYLFVQYLLLHFSANFMVMAFSMVPIICAGRLWGWKSAALTGFLVYLAGMPLVVRFIGTDQIQKSAFVGLMMTAGYTVLGMLIGRITEMRRQLEKELEARMRIEEQLMRSNRELTDFAQVASHDLKEPLRKVVTFCERIAGNAPGLDERNRDYLARMRNAAERMTGLLDGLLEYARVTTKGNPFEETDLSRVVREVLTDLEVRVQETGAVVNVGDLPVVTADPLQMRQLLQNLIGNALKYHRPGVAPEIRVAGRRADGQTVITVEDNGIGIAPEDREKAFGVFRRLVGKNEFEGTGVGLAICKKIVERHDGTITVGDGRSGGTSFRISLPVMEEAA